MPNVLIDQIHGIDPAILGILHSNDLHSARDVLFSSLTDLIEVLNISHTQAVQLQKTVSAHTCPAFTTVCVFSLGYNLAKGITYHLFDVVFWDRSTILHN